MKQLFIYSMLFVFCLCFGSCKSSQQIPKKNNLVSIEDFRSLNQSLIGDSKAVKLSEVVDVREGGTLQGPWARHWRMSDPYQAQVIQWTTVVEDKIHFFVDNVNSEPFCTVYYFNPLGMRWNLMTHCKMWLYTLDENGKITKRRIKRSEILYERVNDSICKMQLDMHETVSGKILIRQYTLSSPYYTLQSVYASLSAPYTYPSYFDLQKIEPWIFQKDIPLLYGKYEIFLPEADGDSSIKSKVIRLGDGEMDIKSKKENVTYVSIWKMSSEDKNNMYTNSYKATKVTATVSNVLPLPKGSNAQPLGIEITCEWEE